MRIFLLYGGSSPERAVAVKGALRVMEAFADSEHILTAHDHRGTLLRQGILDEMRASDAVFLCLHGGEGEGGTLQAALEAAGIFHYTGTGPVGAALALDKARAREVVERVGVPIAKGAVWLPHTAPPSIDLPAVVKPVSGGSSVGLCRITTAAELLALSHTEPLLLEEYLSGREFTVGVLDGEPLPPVEIIPHGGIYDYTHKYTPGATAELCPAPIPREQADRLTTLAMTAYAALGLRDFARIDFKEAADGTPCFLEANTLPGLTKTSLLPRAAEAMGISYLSLCTRMASAAAKRKRASE